MNYKIIGYGSLMSHRSLKKTVSDREFIPVIVYGYKRIFNLKVEKDKDPDMLNVEKSRGDKINGVLFEVNDAELTKIKERESEYNLEKTDCYDFKTGKKIKDCYIVADYEVSLDRNGLLPDKSYFILCREAAYNINKKFGAMWDRTTYTADGHKISNWLKKNRDYDKK